MNRLADLMAVVGALDVSAVPPRRLIGVATYGVVEQGTAAASSRTARTPCGGVGRVAVLVATVKVLSARATDDVPELFDLLMVTDLMSKAERESRDEKLRRYPRVSRYAGRLAAAVKVLLEMTEVKPDLSLEVMWDHIEHSVTRSELRAAVAVIDELVPVDDAELNGQRLEELSGRLATVRIFLPSMMGTVEFGATSDGAPVLAAMKTLAELMTAKTKLPWDQLRALTGRAGFFTWRTASCARNRRWATSTPTVDVSSRSCRTAGVRTPGSGTGPRPTPRPGPRPAARPARVLETPTGSGGPSKRPHRRSMGTG